MVETKELYKDVTNEWISKTTKVRIIFDDFFIDDKGNYHPNTEREKIRIPKRDNEEYKIAKILSEELNTTIHIVPTFTNIKNTQGGTRTPDYIINGQKWDLKTPKYKSEYLNLFNDILRKKQLKKQSNRFIINLINYPQIDENKIKKICNRLFYNKYMFWILGLIIIKDNHIYKVYIKQK